MKNVCVYCSSSDSVGEKYFSAAEQLGEDLVKNNMNLVYGGAAIGLMGKVAGTVKKGGGHVTGIIPKALLQLQQ